MTVSSKFKSYLDKEKVRYQTLEHPLAYTAMEIAGAEHVPGRQVLKPVIIEADGKFVMCVLPAIHYLDLDKVKAFLNAKQVRLAGEQEVAKLFPDYEVGAEPPFGNLHNLPVLADRILGEDEEVAFNAGTHTDALKIKWADYVRLVKPKIAEIGVHIQSVKGHR